MSFGCLFNECFDSFVFSCQNQIVVFLACVQSKLELDAYVSSQAFETWILGQVKLALESRDSGEVALVAFPELIGLPLVFFLERQVTAGKVQDAALELARESWLDALKLGLQYQNFSASSFILPRATHLFEVFFNAFSSAAKATNSFISAGSSFLPGVELEAAKGLHLADGRVQNVSFLFAPSGRILLRSPKLNLTAGLEKMVGLSKGRLEDMATAVTPLGRVTTLICYDGFFERALEKADSLGTEIMVQPSANAALWNGAWSADASKIEGQEWLARGIVQGIQDRVNIRYALNPMMVGNLFDLVFEGRSSISSNLSLTKFEQPILSIASSYTDFEIITARVPDFYIPSETR
jgi:predicted amidohydrolase